MAQVLSEAKNDPTTNCPRLIDFTAAPTSSTIPQYSWPIGVGPLGVSMPRYGHKSEPHTQVAESFKITSVASMTFGSARSSKRMSRGPCRTAPFMAGLLIGSEKSVADRLLCLDR